MTSDGYPYFDGFIRPEWPPGWPNTVGHIDRPGTLWYLCDVTGAYTHSTAPSRATCPECLEIYRRESQRGEQLELFR